MDSSFSPSEWIGEPAASQPELSGKPHWHDLRTRLITARSVFLALSREGGEEPDREPGSFDRGSARALSQLGHGSEHVNQPRIGVGKLVSDNPVPVAGTSMTGARGYK